MVVTPEDDTPDTSALGAAAADATGQNAPMGIAASAAGNPNAAYLIKRAKEEGVDPLDLATTMHYESGNNPTKWGGKGGNYGGLIQFGPEERKKYGVDPENTPYNDQVDASLQFLKDRGFDPKKHGLLDMYSTINAGSPGHYDASDGNGTVASHVQNMLGGSRAAAAKFLASANDPNYAAPNAYAASDASPSSANPAQNAIGAVLSGGAPPPSPQASTSGAGSGGMRLGGLLGQVMGENQQAGPGVQVAQNGSLHDSLMGLSAALMARDNPTAAAVMKGMMTPQSTAKNSMTDNGHVKLGNQWFQENYNPATGQTTRAPIQPNADDLQKDQTNVLNLALAKKKLDDALKPDDPNDDLLKAKPADVKLYQQNSEGMRTTANVVNDMQDFQKLVKDNDLQVNMLASGEAEVRNRLGVADNNSAALKDAQRLMHRIQYEYLKTEAGPATKQKIQQTKEIMFPAGSEYSTPTLLQSFGKAEQQMRDHYSTLKDTNDSYNTGYKGLPKAITNSRGETMSPVDYSKGVYSRWNNFDDKDRPSINGYINTKLSGQGNPQQGAPKSIIDMHNQMFGPQSQGAPASGASGSW